MTYALNELRILSLTSFILFLVYLSIYYKNHSSGIRLISFGYGVYICANLITQYTPSEEDILLYFLGYKLLYPFAIILMLIGTYTLVHKSFRALYISICIIASSITLTSFLFTEPSVILFLSDHIVFGAFFIKLGIDLIRVTEKKGFKVNFSGYTFITWGIVKIIYTFMLFKLGVTKSWFLLDMFICFIAVFGILITYLEYLISKRKLSLIPKKNHKNISIKRVNSIPRKDEVNRDIEILTHIAKNTKDLIYSFSLVPPSSFTYLSSSVYDITGYTFEDYKKDTNLIFNMIHPEDISQLINKLSGNLDFSKPSIQRWYHKNGGVVYLEDNCYPVYNSEGIAIAIHGICRDVTERVKLYKEFKSNNMFDSLTGLLNRQAFMDIIDKTSSENYGIIIVSIDNLRNVNYEFGYEIGDRLLLSTLKIINDFCSSRDTVGRIGGGQFAILTYESLNKIEALCWNILKSSISYVPGNNDEKLSLSIGYSISSDYKSPMDIFAEADKNNYKNKVNKQG